MKHGSRFAMGAAAVALLGGCMGSGYATMSPAAPSYTVARADGRAGLEHPGYFQARVNQRMDYIEEHIRQDVAQGELLPSALDVVAQERAAVDSALQGFSQDGRIDRRERAWTRDRVRQMSQVARDHTAGYGGGPGAYNQGYNVAPPAVPAQPRQPRRVYNYWQGSWEWGL